MEQCEGTLRPDVDACRASSWRAGRNIYTGKSEAGTTACHANDPDVREGHVTHVNEKWFNMRREKRSFARRLDEKRIPQEKTDEGVEQRVLRI
jgi:hypothetical protein